MADPSDKGNAPQAPPVAAPTSAFSTDAAVLVGHLGPSPLPEGHGTLTATDRELIKAETGCSAAVRLRSQWGERLLTVTGPCDRLERAHSLALACIKNHGVMGGRSDATADRTTGRKWRSRAWRTSWWTAEARGSSMVRGRATA